MRSSWKDRLEDSIHELHTAHAELTGNSEDITACNTARTILGSQRCKLCGTMLVPLFNITGPYICNGCVAEFKDKIANGETLFFEIPKQQVDEDGKEI